MRFSNDIIEYLKGDKFSSLLPIKISVSEDDIPTRISFIQKKVHDKSVIHLGCADHINIIDYKVEQDIWMHKKILESALRCLGIDINAEAIDYIKRKYGLSDIICYDFIKDNIVEAITAQKWDYIVLGEILEHVDNPVELLSAIRKKYTSYVDKIIITVPNAFKLSNFRNVLKHQEVNNTDHRYWFTPFTLGKIVTMAGMIVEEFEYCHYDVLPQYNFIKQHIFKKYPAFRNNLVMIAAL